MYATCRELGPGVQNTTGPCKGRSWRNQRHNFFRNMNHVEAQQRLFHNIRNMEGKIKGGCTAKVIQTQNDIEVEFTKKHDIEQLCATQNE